MASLKIDFPYDVINILWVPPTEVSDSNGVSGTSYDINNLDAFTVKGLFHEKRGKQVNTPNGMQIQDVYFAYVDRTIQTFNITTGWRARVTHKDGNLIWYQVDMPVEKTGPKTDPYEIEINRIPGQFTLA